MASVYKRLKELFESRPIWLHTALKMNVPKEMHSKIKVSQHIIINYPRIESTTYPSLFFQERSLACLLGEIGLRPKERSRQFSVSRGAIVQIQTSSYQTIDFRIPEKYVKRIRNKGNTKPPSLLTLEEGEDRKKYYQPSTLPRRHLLDVDVVSITTTEKTRDKGHLLFFPYSTNKKDKFE